MGKYFRTIYLYIVVFATLCMVITGFVGTVYGLVSYVYPTIDEYELEDIYYTYNYEYEYDDEQRYDENKEEEGKDYLQYTAKIEDLIKVEQRTNVKFAFTCLAVFVCGLPLYIYHVKQIKKESEKEV